MTAAGNPGAVGVCHAGAQGAAVLDVTVTASSASFACFAGLNGAGGLHANIRCVGARYGLWIDNSQPVPVAVGATLVNNSISAVVFASQESLSLVGVAIVRGAGASGPAVAAFHDGMSLVDVTIACAIDCQSPISRIAGW
jgi:hypothetical protein